MSLPKYRLTLAVAASLLLGLVLALLIDQTNDTVSVAIAPSPTEIPLEIQWRAGTSQHYELLADTNIKINVSGVSALQNIHTRLTASLEFKTLEAGSTDVLVGMRLTDVNMQVNNISNPDINRGLLQPFRVRYLSSGLPVSFEFPATITAEHRSLIENLIRTFQVVLKPGERWLAQEPNSSGIYNAEYVRSTPSRIQKTKQGFISLDSMMAKASSGISSKETFQITANQSWLSEMEVEETLKIDDPEGFSVVATNHATLLARSSTATAATISWNFIDAPPPPEMANRPPALSLAEAEKEMRSGITALDGATERRAKFVHRLRDLILMDESLPFTLLEAMKTQLLTDRTLSDLYLVLELAGSPQAQAALTSVYVDPSWSPVDATRAIIALGAVEKPTDDTLTVLWGTALGGPSNDERRDVAGTAALALGTIGKGLRVNEDDSYSQFRAGLLDGAMTAADTHQRAVFLHALGNTGDPDPTISRDIVSLINNSEPEIREATARTIGRLGSNEVAGQLVQQLEQEKDSVVRSSLAKALVSWDQPTAPAMATVRSMILIERDEDARLNMARVLGENLSAFPDNKKPLQELLNTDKSKRIRQYIAEVFVAAK
ncbi:MAG: hypothetical protein ACI8XW_002835 [Gammaproteobacteria bacterium]|jgi:hypothetical protein